MLRAIVGVIVGYITMAAVIMVTFSAAYFLMGTERAFLPGSFETSMLWNAVAIVLSIVAALVGGIVCKAISRKPNVVLILAAIVLVLGLISAIPTLISSAPETVREGALGNFEAMNNARQPGWMALLIPFLGVLGVWLGGKLICTRPEEKTEPQT